MRVTDLDDAIEKCRAVYDQVKWTEKYCCQIIEIIDAYSDNHEALDMMAFFSDSKILNNQ